MRQKGFATLEVILLVTILGILSAIAIPRFNSVIIQANTAKVQADLSAIDTAIAVYQMENGNATTPTMDQIKNYMQNPDNLKPPSGKVYKEGTEQPITDTEYKISSGTNPRGTLDDKTSDKFYKNKSTSST